jgi:hypothetical protein
VRHSAQEDGTVVSVGRDGVRVVFDLRYGKDQHSSVGLTMKNSSGLWPRPGELSWRQLAMSDQTETAADSTCTICAGSGWHWGWDDCREPVRLRCPCVDRIAAEQRSGTDAE